MTMHQSCAILAVCFFACSAFAEPRWRNADFEKRGMPIEQQRPIFKGDIAECSGDARERVARSLPRAQMCDPGQNPGMFGLCQQMQDDLKAQKESMFKDLATGCMARKGWLLAD